eukprot:gnl/TRDRNA2_/TRDRNA2_166019_c2_seq1.p1 gnl/TRDRNA2_/TRDRNA2_166019_c2~~gnl/TRDRNA2_/TRDRNA2_166019_c2_seq1.p1  ORF type:complete len:225 (+),score=45.07 gnl/TRDRNA2_/TRDRNA2_166019_c2_seq1:32-676(+)
MAAAAIAARLDDVDGYVRVAAARAMRTLATPGTAEIVSCLGRVAAGDDDEDVRIAALNSLTVAANPGDWNAIAVAVSRCEDTVAEARRAAVLAVGRLAPGSNGSSEVVVNSICALLQDDDASVRRAALETLPEVASGDNPGSATAAAAVAALAAEPDISDQMLIGSLEALGQIGARGSQTARSRAHAAVAAFIGDENWIVREAAENAACALDIG